MNDRGVSRPMAENLPSKDQEQSEQEHRLEKLKAHHKNTLWVYWSLVLLGFWLLAAPFTFGYLNSDIWVDPSGGRGAWWSSETHTELRAWLMLWSDLISGVLLIFFGWRSLKPNRPISLWICCFIGVWLVFAPILFWSPLSVAFYNSSLVGALVIALSILIPGMPNMIMYMQMGPSQPAGWSYNPSSWPQRWILIILGFVGWIVSRYLAAYQLGYITEVWAPFFGFEEGTKKVLDSKMSHSLPISDAGLGSIAYTFEFLMGYMGAPSRWRTMPWMVGFFGILVIPLGLTHIFLVISQPVLVGYWCSLCLLAAMIMLPMIPLEFDEVFAMFQHLKEAKSRGDRKDSLWTIFWKGGKAEPSTKDQRSPELMSFAEQPLQIIRASLWGVSLPWRLVLVSVLSAAFMFVPLWIEVPKSFSHLIHLGGALLVTFSVIATGELVRSLRYLNLVIAAALILGPWMIGGSPIEAKLLSGVFALTVIALSLPRGIIRESYGPWQTWIR